MSVRCRVLVVEPYATGSHARWMDGYMRFSHHDVRRLSMPGRFWKWRMHGGAVTLAERCAALVAHWHPDVVLTTDMLDVAAFAGLSRSVLREVPIAVYFHENQLTYPPQRPQDGWDDSRRRRAQRRDEHYPFINITSALAADHVVWNSTFHRDAFLDAVPAFLGRFPDQRIDGAADAMRAKSTVLPVGIDVASLEAARPPHRPPGPPRLVWNHRWEYDKRPDRFWRAVDALTERGIEFRVVVLGESFVRMPKVMADGLRRHRERVLHAGFAATRAEYARWLWASDVVLSTSDHEFFGISVCEAARCGCVPVLPARLAYPERFGPLVPGELLYESESQRHEALAGVLGDPEIVAEPERHPIKQRVMRAMDDLDWRRVAPRYDDLLAGLAGAPAARARL